MPEMNDMLLYVAMAAGVLVGLIVLATVVRFAVGIIVFLIVIGLLLTVGIGVAAIGLVGLGIFFGLRHLANKHQDKIERRADLQRMGIKRSDPRAWRYDR